jgi:hypothetical protein
VTSKTRRRVLPTFRYNTTDTWYKGNTHIHSTASDGGKTFDELGEMYAGAGYDFAFRTDHWVFSDTEKDSADAPLLWLDGVELDGCDGQGAQYDVVCLGRFTGITPEMGLVAAMHAARIQGGLLILAHPHWSGNSFDDALRWDFDGVEIYNHVCQWLNGKGDGLPYWNAMLKHAPNKLGFAVDDAHIQSEHPGWDGGWIVVNAPTLSRDTISHAIRAGRFYASCGPEFHALAYDGKAVHATTSAVQFARLVGPASSGKRVGFFDDQTLDRVSFEIPQDWPYAYLEIEDTHGRRAWTNTLLVDP